MFFQLFRQVKKIKPDIVHSWSIMTAFYASPICRILKTPHISGFVADCNSLNKFSLYYFAVKFPYWMANAIIGNSQAGLVAYKVPNNKGLVIYNGFEMKRLDINDNREYLRKKLSINTPYIVSMAARFDRMKDFETFFGGAEILLKKRTDITFLAIGKGDLYDEFAKKNAEKGNENIRMLGFRNDIEAIMKITDIGVLCTNPVYHAEGISNSLMEFMAFGKPVIATSGGGVSELIQDFQNGFIITPKHPDLLASKIDILLSDRRLLERIGNNAKDTIVTKFSLDTMTTNYIQLYKEYS